LIESASMRTRDGVRLDADIYRSVGTGTHPVLLMRQPYGRKIASTICYAHPEWYAARGYIVVVQDVRGRGTSEGTFRLFADEADDGFDAIAWAARLPGSNGAVGMYGFSYQGTDQLLAATRRPPALKAIAPAMIGWNVRADWAYENGAFCLRAGLGWAIQIAAETARLAGDDVAFRDLVAAAAAVPVADRVPARPDVMERYRHYTHYFEWLDEPEDSPYWQRMSPSVSAAELAHDGPPMLFVGGWYDTHLRGTLDAYHAIASSGRVPARLVIGPWSHSPWTRRVGALDFGPAAIGEIDLLQVRWFDRWLKSEANGIEREAPVRLFDMGLHDWVDLSAWPHQPARFHLARRGGRVAIDERDGVLALEPSAGVETDYLVHDPWRPAPSIGGAFGTPPGPIDRLTVESRPDVLTYSTAPLRETLSIAGDVAAELRVTADTPDFDISCVLSRVTAAGASYEIAAGYCRVEASSAHAVLTVPMRATCVTLVPGEALRLSVAGAAFPAYPMNAGDGSDPTMTTRAAGQIITLAVTHGATTGSSLLAGVRE
jgi:putative CocE/NonD family hydrolase